MEEQRRPRVCSWGWADESECERGLRDCWLKESVSRGKTSDHKGPGIDIGISPHVQHHQIEEIVIS